MLVCVDECCEPILQLKFKTRKVFFSSSSREREKKERGESKLQKDYQHSATDKHWKRTQSIADKVHVRTPMSNNGKHKKKKWFFVECWSIPKVCVRYCQRSVSGGKKGKRVEGGEGDCKI